jgi:REP element-mobilizing transposase RayT
MGKTLAIHWAGTTHGTWLHGDLRGSWREGRLIGPDPFLKAAATARMNHDSVFLDTVERALVADAFREVVREQRHQVLAATIQASHFHMVLAPLREDIATVIARFKRRSAAAVLGRCRKMSIDAPRSLWTGGKFFTFIFSQSHLWNTIEYVRRHNRREGLPDDPYDWIQPHAKYKASPIQDGSAI